MSTGIFCETAKHRKARFVPVLKRCCLLTAFMLSLLCSEAFAASKHPVTLTPLTPESAVLEVIAGNEVELSVSKQFNGQGMPDQLVNWTVSEPESASVSRPSSRTSSKDDSNEAGIASTVFMATVTGSYIVTASTQENPGCNGKDCATFINSKFTVNVLDKLVDKDGSRNGKDGKLLTTALAATAAVALLLNNGNNGNDRPEPAATRSLAISSGNNQSALRNTPLAIPLVVVAKNNSVTVSAVTINWSVSGGAILNSTTTLTNGLGEAAVSVLNVGPGPGPVTITATRADDPSASVQFTIVINAPALLKISGDLQNAPTNAPVANPLVVKALFNSTAQAGVGISWFVASGDAVISSVSNGGVTDSNGLSSATVSFGPTEGSVVITASRADDPTISQSFTLMATVTPTLAMISGDGQTGPPSTALPSPLVVQVRNNGINASGISVNWSATGGATLSASSTVSNGAGQASVTVTNLGSSLGPVLVMASRADAPAASFTFTANITPPTFTIVSGDGQSGLVGSAGSAPLVVNLVDGGGNPVVGQSITWSVISGSANLTTFSSTTDGAGNASVGFSYGNSAGPITIKASAYSGTATVNFAATALAPSGVTKPSGDGQTGAPGGTLAPFVVQISAPAGVTDLSGVPVTFTITSNIGGTLSVTSTVTDAAGQASTQLTLGLTPGTVTVLAQVQGGPTTTFTVTVSGVLVATTLSAISGDLQTLTPGVASTPMEVQLIASGSPLAGKTINWSTTSGTLSASTSVTDVNGKASVTLTISSGGTISVFANFAAVAEFTGSSVAFTQNSTISSLTSLSVNQAAVGEALDSACAQLQVAPVLTAEEQDLLNQCLALTASGPSSPAAVAEAIDELLPDVAETQAQTGQAAVTAQYDNLKGRMVALRSGASGPSFSGLTLTASGGSIPILALGAALMGEETSAKSSNESARWGVFVSGNIGRGEAEATSLGPSYDFDVNGITVGADYRMSDRLVLGAALGYTRQDTTLSGGQGSVDMSGFSISGYASWYQKSSWYIDSSLTFGHGSYDHARHIAYSLPLPGGGSMTVDQQAKASSGSTDVAAAITLGRDFHKGAWAFGVYGSALYSRLGFDAFEERLEGASAGSGLGLRVDSRRVTALSSVIGGKVDYAHSTGWGVLMPHLQLEWQHEYKSDPEAFRAFLLNDPTNTPITIVGDSVDSSYFRVGLGLSMIMSKGRSGFMLYERFVARGGISQDNLTLGFRMEF